jgi:hypothetical protein
MKAGFYRRSCKLVACPRLPWGCCGILSDSHAHGKRGHATELAKWFAGPEARKAGKFYLLADYSVHFI